MPTINSPATIIALLKRAKTAYQKVKPDPKTKPELRYNDIVKDLQRLQDIVRKKANKGSDKLVKPFNARKRIVLKKLTEHRKSINTTAEKKVDGNTAQLPAFIKALLKITTAVLRLNFATATPDEEKISLEGLEEGNLVELDKLDQLSNEELNNLEREDSDDLPEQVPITTESLTNSLKSIQQTNAQEFLRLSQKLNNAAKLKQQGIQPGMLDKVLHSIREEIDNAAKSTPRSGSKPEARRKWQAGQGGDPQAAVNPAAAAKGPTHDIQHAAAAADHHGIPCQCARRTSRRRTLRSSRGSAKSSKTPRSSLSRESNPACSTRFSGPSRAKSTTR